MDGITGLIAPGERLDDLQRGGLRVLQHPDRFRFGTDSVLLAHFAAPKPGERVLDLGTGSGVLLLLMAGRTPEASYTGIEIQPEMADMAARSVRINRLDDRIEILEMDLRRAPEALSSLRFDRVVCNPPYGKAGASYPAQSEALRIARHEAACTPEDIARCAAALLVPGGRICLCHQPARILDVGDALRASGLTPKRLRMVLPAPGDPPCLLLIEGVKGAREGLRWDAPLLLRDARGCETDDYRLAYGLEGDGMKTP